MKVGIIGAGAAGLTAAFTLGKAGHQATVFEADSFLGGQASTFDVGGGRLEKGYHHLFTSDTDILDLVSELGLEHKMAWIESKVGIFYDGKIYDFVTPGDLLRFTPLSLIDRLRMGLVTLYLQRYKDWRKLENVTASQWIRKYAGKGAYDVVWGPLLRGKFGAYYDQVAMPWFWGKIHTRFASRGKGFKGMQRERLGYPLGSFAEIFEVLTQRISDLGGEVRLSTPVRSIVVEDGRAAGLEIQDANGKVATHSFDVVLATTPSYVLPRLAPSLPQEYLEKLQRVSYLSAVVVILVIKEPFSRIYWLNIADRSIPFVGLIEQTNFLDPSFYGGKHILYISNYLGEDSPLFSMKDSDLLEEYIPHLKKINPRFDRSWIEEWHYHKLAAAQPVIGTSYSQWIPEHRTPIARLYLANTTQIYPEDRGTNYSVRMGKHVAGMIVEDMR
ncbi:MAG: NAD(P)/FAD-dependent oxidoreductase [Chloroflexi bacterium]|nr:NAD(P)/FAD-dependent oxidoreductase [Chloroflexota bacterium]